MRARAGERVAPSLSRDEATHSQAWSGEEFALLTSSQQRNESRKLVRHSYLRTIAFVPFGHRPGG